MAIHDILREVKNVRKVDTDICESNGLLKDYFSIIKTVERKKDDHTILSQLFEKGHDLRICTNLRLSISRDTIANQIICYKDSFKLPKGTIKCLCVVYGSFDGHQKAIILTLGDKEEYVMAETLYCIMSKPENGYEGMRNEIIALSVNMGSVDTLLDTVESLLEGNRKVGIVQREFDAKLSLDYDGMYGLAQKIANYRLVNLRDILTKCDDKEECINGIIANWLLPEKFPYVQYMMDRNNLNRVCEGNVKKQCQVAREECDVTGFASCSELWKLVKKLRQEIKGFFSLTCQT